MNDTTLPRFSHHQIDAYQVALEALVRGDRIARRLPRGYGKLKDQLQERPEVGPTGRADCAVHGRRRPKRRQLSKRWAPWG